MTLLGMQSLNEIDIKNPIIHLPSNSEFQHLLLFDELLYNSLPSYAFTSDKILTSKIEFFLIKLELQKKKE